MFEAFCPQFLAAMALVCLFLAALLCCGVGVVPCLPCGLAYGGGIVCRVFVSNTVWACVVDTLNVRVNFRSGVWVGCSLCFAVFAASMVSVMVLGCGWGCMVGVALALGVAGWWECGWDAFGGPCARCAGLVGWGAWVSHFT